MIQSLIPILLSVHLLLCLFLIGAILLQRSEGGGALGMGGGPSSMMSGRSATTFITRATTVLAGAFFVTSLLLTVLGSQGTRTSNSVMEDGTTSKDGLPTKSVDLSVPKAKAPVNAVEQPSSGIPASSADVPPVAPLFPPSALTPATPAEKTPPEKK